MATILVHQHGNILACPGEAPATAVTSFHWWLIWLLWLAKGLLGQHEWALPGGM